MTRFIKDFLGCDDNHRTSQTSLPAFRCAEIQLDDIT